MNLAVLHGHPSTCSGCPACSEEMAAIVMHPTEVDLHTAARRSHVLHTASAQQTFRVALAQRTAPTDAPPPPLLFTPKAPATYLRTSVADDPNAAPPPPSLIDALVASRRK